MRRMQFFFLCIAVAALSGSCASSDAEPDDVGAVNSGAIDAGAVDSGAIDAGVDSGAVEADGDALADAPDGEAPPDTGTPADAAAPVDAGPDARLLTISVVEMGSPGSGTSAYAAVGNPPFQVPLGPAALVRGDCAYHPELLPVLCEPACAPPEFCGFDGTCQVHEERFDPGPIVVTGLKSAVTLTPSGPYYYYAAVMDPEPTDGDLFDEHSTITAIGGGTAQFPAFSASGVGVAALETPLPCQIDPQPDEDLLVTWEPAGSGAIRFVMQSGNHGEQFSHIVCEVSDQGSVVVDADLLALYLADWRPIEAWRLSRTLTQETTLPGARVQVEARSEVGCFY